MSAWRHCDPCDRVTIWNVTDEVDRGVKCTGCGNVERQFDGRQFVEHGRAIAADEVVHAVGCSRPPVTERRDVFAAGLVHIECGSCHAATWRKAAAS